jgi:hypothetical protein
MLLVLGGVVAGLLLGVGAFWVASGLGGMQVQDLGDPVRFDPARVTVTPRPNPTTIPNATVSPQPEQVVPPAPSPADDADDDAGDDSDDDADDD